jgi:hypothetical protein
MGTLNKKEKRILIIENFLPNLNHYLEEIHKITTYELKDYNDKFKLNETWPGKRSEQLKICSPFLFHLILQNLNKIDFLKKYSIKLFVHLRRNSDFFDDWIHVDKDDYAFLIYLNKDNLNSGTYIYNEKEEIVADVKYVQNRFVLYNGSYLHKGYGHFGSNEGDGRLTINGFITTYDN